MVRILPGAALQGFIKSTDAIAAARARNAEKKAERALKQKEIDATAAYRRENLDIQRARAAREERLDDEKTRKDAYEIALKNLDRFRKGEVPATASTQVQDGLGQTGFIDVPNPDLLTNLRTAIDYEQRITGSSVDDRSRFEDILRQNKLALGDKELKRKQNIEGEFEDVLKGGVNFNSLNHTQQQRLFSLVFDSNIPVATKYLTDKRHYFLQARGRGDKRKFLSDFFPKLSKELLLIGNESFYNEVIAYNQEQKRNDYDKNSLDSNDRITREDAAYHFLRIANSIFERNKDKHVALKKIKDNTLFMNELKSARQIFIDKFKSEYGDSFDINDVNEVFKRAYPQAFSALIEEQDGSADNNNGLTTQNNINTTIGPIYTQMTDVPIVNQGRRKFTHVARHWNSIRTNFLTAPPNVQKAITRMVEYGDQSELNEQRDKDFELISQHIVNTYKEPEQMFSVVGGLVLGTRLKSYFSLSGLAHRPSVSLKQEQMQSKVREKQTKEYRTGLRSAKTGIRSIDNMLGLLDQGEKQLGYKHLAPNPVTNFLSFTTSVKTILKDAVGYVTGTSKDNSVNEILSKEDEADSRIGEGKHGAAALLMINNVKANVKKEVLRIEDELKAARKKARDDPKFTFNEQDYRLQQRIQMAKVHLAYQMAGVFQGASSGSRTISDADFQIIQEALFATTNDATKAKLRELKSILHMAVVEQQSNLDAEGVSRLDLHSDDTTALLLKVKRHLTQRQISDSGNTKTSSAHLTSETSTSQEIDRRLNSTISVANKIPEYAKGYFDNYQQYIGNNNEVLNLDNVNYGEQVFPVVDDFVYDSKIVNKSGLAEKILDSDGQLFLKERNKKDINLTTYFKLGYIENSPTWDKLIEYEISTQQNINSLKQNTIDRLNKTFNSEGKITERTFLQIMTEEGQKLNIKPEIINFIVAAGDDGEITGLLTSAQSQFREDYQQEFSPYENMKRFLKHRKSLLKITRFSSPELRRNRIAVDGQFDEDKMLKIAAFLQAIKNNNLDDLPTSFEDVNNIFKIYYEDRTAPHEI